MSKEEVMRALDEMKQTYEGNVIDITDRSHDSDGSSEEGERLLSSGKG
jgi:hypothetical protein